MTKWLVSADLYSGHMKTKVALWSETRVLATIYITLNIIIVNPFLFLSLSMKH